MPTDPFDLRAVEQAIASTEFAGHLTHLATTPSTNDIALQAAQSGARCGVWIADAQTAGRGRGSHAWYSVAGTPLEPAGLYMTALIAPPVAMLHALSLSLTTAIAVQSAISSVAGFHRRDQIDIRWPNDLLLNGRKCGGILIETASIPATPSQPATLRYAVIGIGINVNHTIFPPELDPIATSLRRELPQPTEPFRREPLAAAILLALDEEIRLMIRSWRGTNNRRDRNLTQYSSWISGKRVHVEERNDGPGGYTGITAGLDRSGFLLVNGDDGQLHTVLSGGLREP
jgi:BirA family transcriptional regulator, biotin operon repressor / biotin---[acetyl-CoA-carboxylase] ligase